MASSTSGYIPEIGSPHDRHFALSHIQPNTGTLSYHFIGVSHRGHRDPGATIDKSSGIRKMHTLRKLPINNPNTKMKAMTKVCAATSLCYALCHTRLPPSTRPHPLSVRCLTNALYRSVLLLPRTNFFCGFLFAPITVNC